MSNLYEILLRDEMESIDVRRKLARKILRGDISATVAITPPTPIDCSARELMRFYHSDGSKTRTVQAISVPQYRTAIESLESGAAHSDVLLKAVTVDFTELPRQEPHSDDCDTFEPIAHRAADDAAPPRVSTISYQAPTSAAPVVPQPPDTTGMVAWQAAILENLPAVLDSKGNKTTARDVLRWCRSEGPRDVFPKGQPDARETFAWIDGDGNHHTTKYSRVSNVWSEWRTAGKIPAKK